MKRKWIFPVCCLLAIFVLVSLSTIAHQYSEIKNLKAEIGALRTAMDAATVLAANQNGKVFLRHLLSYEYGREDGVDTTLIQVILPGPEQQTTTFHVLDNGLVEDTTSVWDGYEFKKDTNVGNWGNFGKWQRK